MKQWQLGSQPGWEHLELADGPALEPGPYDVVVRLRAASLNYRDLLVASLPERHVAGRVPASDGAGEVVAVGESVTKWRVGDRVVGLFFATGGRDGLRAGIIDRHWVGRWTGYCGSWRFFLSMGWGDCRPGFLSLRAPPCRVPP